MKVYFLISLAFLWGIQAIYAFPRQNNAPDCSHCEDGETLPDANSCAQYYLCISGKPLPRCCAPGLFYDAVSGLCNRAFLVDCSRNSLGRPNEKEEEQHVPPPKVPCTTKPPCTTTTCTTTKATPQPNPTKPPCTATAKPTPSPAPAKTTCTTTTCAPTTKPPCAATKTTATTCTTTKKPPCTETKTTCTTTTCTTTKKPPCTTTTCPPPKDSDKKPADPLRYRQSSRDCTSLDEGTILLDSNHCGRYYVCTNQRTRRIKCNTGTWFDRDTLTCRPPGLVTNCPVGRY